MRKETRIKENLVMDRQLQAELPGSWYNYESKETTLSTRKSDHWLARLEASLRTPASDSPA